MISGGANSGGILRPLFIYLMDRGFNIIKRVLLVGWELGRGVFVLYMGSIWLREKIWMTIFRVITAYFIGF